MATYSLRREIPVEEGYDIVVAGGGPAGCAAAVCAARLGARVLLVEALGCLGGTGTSGLVTEFDPMANGEQMLVGGFMRELIETLYERGCVPTLLDPKRWRLEFHKWSPFDAEGLKVLLDELTVKAGVEVRFFTRVIDADVAEDSLHINGVVLQNVEGYRYVKAKAFVDATGDAVLADLCGVTCYAAGRDTQHIMPPTLCALFCGIDWAAMGNDIGLRDHQKKVEQAVTDGFFSQPDRHVPGMFMSMGQVGSLNAGHVFGMDSLQCNSLSEGMMRGRRLVQEYKRFYQTYFPGLENLQLVHTAAMMGIRESRRILGEYVLDYDDYTARRKFPDQIAIFCKAVDIHVYDCTPEQYERYYSEFTKLDKYKPGEYYGIPYGVLVPKGSDNLWVAGRCVSTDVKVQGSLRVQPAASMMGQAAGVAAVQAVARGCSARAVNTADLVTALRKQGANLPQAELASSMSVK